MPAVRTEDLVALFAPPEYWEWSKVFDWKIKGFWTKSYVLIDKETGAILERRANFEELNKVAMEKYNELFEQIVLA